MDPSKFTEKSQAALVEAQNIATRNHHQAVDVEHLMLGLLKQEGGLIPFLFERAKVPPDLLKTKLQEELNRSRLSPATPLRVPASAPRSV